MTHVPTSLIRPRSRFAEVASMDDVQKIEALYRNVDDIYNLLSGVPTGGWNVMPTIGSSGESFSFMMMEV